MFSIYPAGAPGLGLLLMRIACAGLWLSTLVHGADLPLWLAIAGGVVAFALLLGVATRPAAAISVAAILAAWFDMTGAIGALTLLHALNAGALALLGAGAYSADARLFGRREIRIEG